MVIGRLWGMSKRKPQPKSKVRKYGDKISSSGYEDSGRDYLMPGRYMGEGEGERIVEIVDVKPDLLKIRHV